MADRGFEWQPCDPAEVGMDAKKLEALRQMLAERNTAALLIIRRDKIVCEWYAPGFGPDVPHPVESCAKGLIAGTALTTAINDGYLSLNDLACTYIPAWRDDPVRSKITIRHLISHSSGMDDAREPGKTHLELSGWKFDFWPIGDVLMDAEWRKDDPFTMAVYQIPIIFEPGSVFYYSNPGYAALAYALTASLKDSPYTNIHIFLRDRIMRRIGVRDDEWIIGYNRRPVVDGMEMVATWGGASYTARAAARVARLMMRLGDWEGEELLNKSKALLGLTYTGEPLSGPGRNENQTVQCLGWGNNANGVRLPMPRDGFMTDGRNHQFIYAVPSLDLIFVRFGKYTDNRPDFSPNQEYFIDPVIDAVVA